MIGRILTVGGLTLLSRITGFVRDIVLAAVLGAGPVADAFFVALRLPNHFRAIFAEGAFNAAFVPAYARIREPGGAETARLFARSRVHACCWRARSCCWRSRSIFTPAVIALLAPGFADDPGKFALAVELTRITFPYLLLVTLVTLYGGILNALDRFAAAAAAPILLNLSIDGGAGAGCVLSDAGTCRGLGRADRGMPRSAAARRRCDAAGRAAGVPLAAARRGDQALSQARSGRRRSARPARRSRCSPTPSSRAFSPPARCRRSIMPTGSTSCRSA